MKQSTKCYLAQRSQQSGQLDGVNLSSYLGFDLHIDCEPSLTLVDVLHVHQNVEGLGERKERERNKVAINLQNMYLMK